MTWLMAERGLDVTAAGKSGNRKIEEEAPGSGQGAGSSGSRLSLNSSLWTLARHVGGRPQAVCCFSR